MKDDVEIGHLTKFDAFRVNRDEVMDLEIWFKVPTNVSNFDTASPKTYPGCQRSSRSPAARNAAQFCRPQRVPKTI